MATQEERLQIVENDLKHFKTETIKAYGDMAMELVMVKGLTEDSVRRLADLQRTLDKHTVLLNKQDEHLNRVESTLGEHTVLFNKQDERLNRVESTLGEHTTILGEHTTILGEHTTILGEHTTILGEHTARFD